MALEVTGKAIKMGNDVNTDIIIPSKYLIYMDMENLAKYAFNPLGEEFRAKMKQSQVIVAGRNFGCGSSREQGATAIRAMGIKAVVAKSFARIFFRNAINSGLLVIEQPELINVVEDGDQIDINVDKGIITAKGKEYTFPPLPPQALEMLEYGGLFEYLKKQIELGKI